MDKRIITRAVIAIAALNAAAVIAAALTRPPLRPQSSAAHGTTLSAVAAPHLSGERSPQRLTGLLIGTRTQAD